MSVLFFDTSALIRRYDRTEPGSERVRALCEPRASHTVLIARITQIEVASALNRKLREGVLSAEALDRLWQLFGAHRRDHYRVIALDEPTYLLGERLLFAHRLRAYDSLQLACALRTARLLGNIASDYRFCTGDQAQSTAARNEGLNVEQIQ